MEVTDENATQPEDNLDKSLDDLLAEFERDVPSEQNVSQETPEQSTEVTQESGQGKDPRVDELYEWAQSEAYERAVEAQERDIEQTVKGVQAELSDLPVEMSDKWVRGILEHEYRINGRFQRAWDNRHDDPKGWSAALHKATQSIKKEVQNRPDPDATANYETVASAVRAASSKTAEPEQKVDRQTVDKLDDREFNKLAKQMGF